MGTMKAAELPDPRARVQRGVEALDKALPGWATTIDVNSVDIGTRDSDVIALAFQSAAWAQQEVPGGQTDPYALGMERLGLQGEEDAKAHGFDCYVVEEDHEDEPGNIDICALHDLWYELIWDRQHENRGSGLV